MRRPAPAAQPQAAPAGRTAVASASAASTGAVAAVSRGAAVAAHSAPERGSADPDPAGPAPSASDPDDTDPIGEHLTTDRPPIDERIRLAIERHQGAAARPVRSQNPIREVSGRASQALSQGEVRLVAAVSGLLAIAVTVLVLNQRVRSPQPRQEQPQGAQAPSTVSPGGRQRPPLPTDRPGADRGRSAAAPVPHPRSVGATAPPASASGRSLLSAGPSAPVASPVPRRPAGSPPPAPAVAPHHQHDLHDGVSAPAHGQHGPGHSRLRRAAQAERIARLERWPAPLPLPPLLPPLLKDELLLQALDPTLRLTPPAAAMGLPAPMPQPDPALTGDNPLVQAYGLNGGAPQLSPSVFDLPLITDTPPAPCPLKLPAGKN
ncbi:MAG: hypothetical protein RLZZ219_353 [Cyanobacteriota bacterium]